jgi:hypothetical protein
MSEQRPIPPGPRTQYEQSWLAGAELGEAIAKGWRPPPQHAPIALAAGESVLAQTAVRVWQYTGQDVTYNEAWFVSFGGPLLFGASLLGSALYNNSQRTRAQALAAAQWRPTSQGHLYLTNSRIALALSTGWVDIDYRYLRASTVEAHGIVIMLAGQPPIRLQVWPPHWFFVLLRFLAYGEVIRVDIPPHLRRPSQPTARGLALSPARDSHTG